MRTIIFNTEHVTANTKESFLFIAFLLLFALMASAYVLKRGLEDEKKSIYKLILECILIITSVVPPELPMELALAVNTSLAALVKLGELRRIDRSIDGMYCVIRVPAWHVRALIPIMFSHFLYGAIPDTLGRQNRYMLFR